jgi:hypothetical protein
MCSKTGIRSFNSPPVPLTRHTNSVGYIGIESALRTIITRLDGVQEFQKLSFHKRNLSGDASVFMTSLMGPKSVTSGEMLSVRSPERLFVSRGTLRSCLVRLCWPCRHVALLGSLGEGDFHLQAYRDPDMDLTYGYFTITLFHIGPQ